MATRSDINKITVRDTDDLCLIAESLGHKQVGRFAINQLQCNNGAYVSSLLNLLNDNPDLINTIRDWVVDHLAEDDNEDEDDEYDDERR